METGPDAPVVDTHVHVASDDRSRFPLRPTGVGRQWWGGPGRDAAALLAEMDNAGVDRAVLVQPVGAYGYDNTYVLDAVATSSERLCAVPALDMDDPATDDRGVATGIRRLAEHPGVVGVRLFAVAPGSSWAEAPKRAQSAFSAAADAGVVLVLTVFAQHIGSLGPVLHDFPEVTVALDHCGFPELTGARLRPGSPLLGLRDAPSVVLKVTSHLLMAASAGGDPAELVSELVGSFGADRLSWGSDHPQTGDDYPALVALAHAAVGDLAPDARSAFFGGNAARIFPAR